MMIPEKDTVWDVLQYHIHAGSDHSLDGQHFGADMHIVHKNRNGDDLSVLGMFLEPSSIDATSYFDVLIAGLKSIAEETEMECGMKNSTAVNSTDSDIEIEAAGTRRHRQLQDVYNPYTKLPPNATMYSYSGSLTTPPCSEIVTWNVVDTPISLSIIEFDDIINAIFGFTDPETCKKSSVFSPSGFTSRPAQPLNGRTITHFCPTGTESRFEVASPAASPVAAPAGTPTNSTSAAATAGFMTTMAVALFIATVAMF
jgi:carbonic anhydrase